MAKTSCYVFLSRKGDISEPPLPSPISMLFLKCLSLKVLRRQHWGGGGGGGRDNVRGKENVQDSIKSSRLFRIVLSPAGFPKFCHNFCPALLPCDTSIFLDKDPAYKTWALTLVYRSFMTFHILPPIPNSANSLYRIPSIQTRAVASGGQGGNRPPPQSQQTFF